MKVVSNTSPLNYLTIIGHLEILPKLYGTVSVPPAVISELRNEASPNAVKELAKQLPQWLVVCPLRSKPSGALAYLGRGEQKAITLASEFGGSSLIIDDREGRREAELRGVATIGLLGVIADAAGNGMIDLRATINQLRQTSFRASPRLLNALLEQLR